MFIAFIINAYRYSFSLQTVKALNYLKENLKIIHRGMYLFPKSYYAHTMNKKKIIKLNDKIIDKKIFQIILCAFG